MKKYLILLSIFFALSCIGCSNNEEKEEDSPQAKSIEIEIEETSDSEVDNADEESDTVGEQETSSVSEEEEWTPLTMDQAPADYNCEFCLGCGKTEDEVEYITRWGYCDPCFDTYAPCGRCSYCGVAMNGSDTVFYDGTRCSVCQSRCDYCGGYLDEDTFDTLGGTYYVDSLCYARYIVGCYDCGAKNDTVDASSGLCAECGEYNYCSLCGSYMPNGEARFESGYRFCQNCVDTYGGENVFNILVGQY